MNAYIYNADIYCEECALQIKFDLLADALVSAGAVDARMDLVYDGDQYQIALPPSASTVIDHLITPTGSTLKNILPCDSFEVFTESEINKETGEVVNIHVCLTPPDDERTFDSGEWPKGPYDQDYEEADSPQNCGSGASCANAFVNGSYEHDGEDCKVGVFLQNTLTADGYRYLMDPSQRFAAIAALKRELHSEGTGDARGMQILAEIRALEADGKKQAKLAKAKLPKDYASRGWNADGTMDVLGGYVLDMKDKGKLIGHRRPDGSVQKRNPSHGKVNPLTGDPT